MNSNDRNTAAVARHHPTSSNRWKVSRLSLNLDRNRFFIFLILLDTFSLLLSMIGIDDIWRSGLLGLAPCLDNDLKSSGEVGLVVTLMFKGLNAVIVEIASSPPIHAVSRKAEAQNFQTELDLAIILQEKTTMQLTTPSRARMQGVAMYKTVTEETDLPLEKSSDNERPVSRKDRQNNASVYLVRFVHGVAWLLDKSLCSGLHVADFLLWKYQLLYARPTFGNHRWEKCFSSDWRQTLSQAHILINGNRSRHRCYEQVIQRGQRMDSNASNSGKAKGKPQPPPTGVSSLATPKFQISTQAFAFTILLAPVAAYCKQCCWFKVRDKADRLCTMELTGLLYSPVSPVGLNFFKRDRCILQ